MLYPGKFISLCFTLVLAINLDVGVHTSTVVPGTSRDTRVYTQVPRTTLPQNSPTRTTHTSTCVPAPPPIQSFHTDFTPD